MISQLGRYEVLSELGQGAMGTVYKAKDPIIDRIVAIKTINLGLALDEKEEYEARFYQEAKAAGRLSHPNIVTVFDVGKTGDVAYIAMEFLRGRELRDILDENPRLPVNQVVDIAIQVAQGLSYAHEHGIVHRDVKPSNIMVIRDGHVKITDFGIARMASSTVLTQTGVVLGSPKYMSPEQVLGKPIDQRSDIFSLGVMLYEMLTGQPPFSGESINAVMYQTLNSVAPPPNTLNPDVPAMLNFIVNKALAKGVDDRYQNAHEFADDLRACRDSLPRSSTLADTAKTQLAATSLRIPDAIPVSRLEVDAEDSQPMPLLRLSSNFDSFDATMRLTALTAPEDIEDISNTLRLTYKNLGTLIQAAPQATMLNPSTAALPEQSSQYLQNANSQHAADNRKLLLIMITLLLLLGLAFVF